MLHDTTPAQGLMVLAQRVLARAGFKIGGDALAKHLGVPDEVLTRWLTGKSVPPMDIILRAIDVLEPGFRPPEEPPQAKSVRSK
jgi:hypothetical protein